jgi:ATP-binding cassette, subfamily B, bacterial
MSNSTDQATKLAVHRYLRQIWRERKLAIPGLLLPGVGNILGAYVPPLIVAAILVRFKTTRPDLHQVLPYLVLFALTWLSGELIWRISDACLNKAVARSIRNLYQEAMAELIHKDIGFFHDNFAGALTKKVVGYGKNFDTFVSTLSYDIASSFIPLLFAVVVLWRFSPLLVFGLLGFMVVIGAVLLPLIRRRQRLVHARELASNRMAGYVADVISNMDAVQAFAHEQFELSQSEKLVADYTKKSQASWDFHNTRINMAISPLYVLTNVMGLALAILFGKNATSLATIFISFSYYTSTTRVLWQFNHIYRSIENAISEAAQYTQLLLVPNKLTEPAEPIKLNLRRGKIEFRNVDFAYSDDAADPLFENLNLHIAPGEKLALVGHSGGGKTTVTKLLLRFVDVTSGELLIDGQNIAHGPLQDLRSSIAYVPQEPIMFHRTLRENIRYGKLGATDAEIIEAAKKANAHEFIEKLPHGYETLVGERGVKLSGGQRQRVAIARAMIKDAPILVLDEATSALDSESERLIQDALWRLMEGRTAIVIAHRLSTIQRLDRIVVLDNGAISEQGSHAELLANDGIYAKLWSHQSGGFLDDDDTEAESAAQPPHPQLVTR